MAIYELRTYTILPGRMPEAVTLFRESGWAALEKYQDKLVGYFLGDIGAINKVVHIWKFDDEADRRKCWNSMFKDPDVMSFAAKYQPLIQYQENQLMTAAPWGPHP
ncbi:NIPSNAP family protein [Minwuia thermotolerans]|uniref:NIPSNAP family protein n=1 Tax=Minwuia thermotolerans TaxID=2056226 RepID=A0A2M9G7P3_9PROT|nr:NIPSNAP family protein [Minwuia thermotolerans]PJK31722.1 NIPSNAP family protein [Minwuia thermotolerans]